LAGSLPIHLVTSGDEAARAQIVETFGAISVLRDERSSVSDALGVAGTPTAIYIDDAGRVASEPAGGANSIEALIRVTLDRRRQLTAA
jgi:hypothetical protein